MNLGGPRTTIRRYRKKTLRLESSQISVSTLSPNELTALGTGLIRCAIPSFYGQPQMNTRQVEYIGGVVSRIVFQSCTGRNVVAGTRSASRLMSSLCSISPASIHRAGRRRPGNKWTRDWYFYFVRAYGCSLKRVTAVICAYRVPEVPAYVFTSIPD